MSSSTPKAAKFLLDENVHAELAGFCRKRGVDFELAVKGSQDKVLAVQSVKNKLIIVTNDSDFASMSRSQVFGVVWLKLPQNNEGLLLSLFGRLLDECAEFEGQLILLDRRGWSSVELSL